METQNKENMLDIIKHDVESGGGNFNEVYAALKQGIEDGSIRILRHGNTLLTYKIIGKGVADAAISTLDKPDEIVKAFIDFFHALKISGFSIIYIDESDAKYMPLFEMAKISVHQDQNTNKLVIEVK
jgi:hypothetical protein